MPVPELHIRCKTCTARFPVKPGEARVACPECGAGWKLVWLEGDQPMIIAPASWHEYHRRTVEQWG